MFQINKEVKIFFNYVIGPLLGVWLFYSLYQQVKSQPHLHTSIKFLTEANGRTRLEIILVVAMVFINWGVEARKWQILVKLIQPISFYMAFKGILSGVSLSINTPNRIGEYGGRMLFIKEGNRLKSISLSIAGSIAQLIITLMMGAAGLIYLLLTISPNVQFIMGLSIFWIRILMYASLLTGSMLLLFFFKLSILFKWIDSIPFLHRYRYFLDTMELFKAKLLLRLLSLSFFRYMIFVLQYILLMQVMQINTTFFQGLWAISVLYLIMAIIPSIAIAELGIRGKFSIALLSLYSTDIIGIMGSTFGIWFLNLFIPALCGSVFILSNKFFNETKSTEA